ncbi:hypothetical protein GALMADRAFT_236309 [Galerina marginata CBS 339.88]|uniref:Uncharacterized protein n=1 Tax=Galerina marginata (strain CBS 339.88) TaxID=685588 RepID=A0A067TXT8_GALM3|nr:hypothetical protein GALMADRAFT_236309 [Galerina marginata CBS 339.88]
MSFSSPMLKVRPPPLQSSASTAAASARYYSCSRSPLKWADTNPPPKQAGYNNTGWPGCCRPPNPTEYNLIGIEEWYAVSTVHRIAIPPQVEAVLKSLPLPPKTNNAQPTSPTTRSTPSKPSTPSSVRKNSAASTPPKSGVLATKAMNTPSQGRGRSPQGSIMANLSRTPSGNVISSSVPSSSSMDTIRRKTNPGTPDRRIEGTQSSHSSPSRKSIDLENPISPRRVSSVRRPALTPATTSVSLSKVFAADTRSPQQTVQDGTVRRRSSVSGSVPSPSTPSQTPRNPELPLSFIVPRTSKRDDDCSASSSSGSSDGLGSISDSTVTSDGGFTDYLSDESEAELQRQAEARAVVVAQSQAEELEFKMARQQLAHVGLRPPKSWNPTNTPPKVST